MSDHLLSILEAQIQNQEQLLREREQSLEALRRDRDRLGELIRQRGELQNQVRAVEGDIALLERTMSSTLSRFEARPEAAPPTPAPPASAPPSAAAPPAKVEPTPTPMPEQEPEPAAEPAPADAPKLTLRDSIRQVLRTSRVPLTGPEIADKVLAAGYATQSTNFPNTVKMALSQMDDVENVKGQGTS